MSEWGSIVTALEAEVRQAIATLPTGTRGFEQGLRPVNVLASEEFPHVFAYTPRETRSELDWFQQQSDFSIRLGVWTRDDTAEQLWTKLDAIQTEVKGNPTLGGLVDFAFCSERAQAETIIGGQTFRLGQIVVSARKVVR